jgi:hypothetical protein
MLALEYHADANTHFQVMASDLACDFKEIYFISGHIFGRVQVVYILV